MKKVIKNVLHFWYVYVLLIAAATIGTIYYCDFINRPKAEKTISLFVSSYSLNNNKLYDFLKEKSPSYLREINISFANPKSPEFEYQIVNKGLNKADMFILPKSYVFDSLVEKQFASLNQDVLNNYFIYETDSYGKGIVMHKVGQQDNDLFTFVNTDYPDEEYYLYYRVNSIHIKGLNDAKFDTALMFTKELLNYGQKEHVF